MSRELQSVVPQLGHHQTNVYINQLVNFIGRYGLPNRQNCQLLMEIFNNRNYADIFAHELEAFASCPFDSLSMYDDKAIYWVWVF